jgi:hypothetical protein
MKRRERQLTAQTGRARLAYLEERRALDLRFGFDPRDPRCRRPPAPVDEVDAAVAECLAKAVEVGAP